jgi:hypothetical protein
VVDENQKHIYSGGVRGCPSLHDIFLLGGDVGNGFPRSLERLYHGGELA